MKFLSLFPLNAPRQEYVLSFRALTSNVSRGQSRARDREVPANLLVILACAALFLSPDLSFAQRGARGGAAAPLGGGLSAGGGRPDGIDEGDDLKDFHHALEVQASSDQAAAFRNIVKHTEEVNRQFTVLEKQTRGSQWAERTAELKRSLDGVRTQTNNFVDALSPKQKTALKDVTARVAKAESELAREESALGSTSQTAPQPDASASGAANLSRAFDNFQSEQVKLAQEMGISLSDGESQVAFNVPPVKTSVEVGRQQVAVLSSGIVSRAVAANGEGHYHLRFATDLSDLQNNLTAVLRAQLDSQPRCGERIQLREASVSKSDPTSTVVAHIYAERWVCTRMMGSVTPTEVAEGTGTAEVTITASADPHGELHAKTDLSRVEGDPFVVTMLKSGSLGTDLREAIESSLLTLSRTANLQSTLPPTTKDWPTIQSARFETNAEGDLSIVLEGEMKMSDEQAEMLAKQLKERPSLQASQAK